MKHIILVTLLLLGAGTFLATAQTCTSFEEAFSKAKSVTTLDLSGKKLKTLPDNIGKLKNLEILDLRPQKLLQYGPHMVNPINGNMIQTLPDGIGKLRYLKKLNLQATDLRSLPGSFTNLQNLTHLDLSYNPRIDPRNIIETLSTMPNLRYINVAGCKFKEVQIDNLRKGCPDAHIVLAMELTRK